MFQNKDPPTIRVLPQMRKLSQTGVYISLKYDIFAPPPQTISPVLKSPVSVRVLFQNKDLPQIKIPPDLQMNMKRVTTEVYSPTVLTLVAGLASRHLGFPPCIIHWFSTSYRQPWFPPWIYGKTYKHTRCPIEPIQFELLPQPGLDCGRFTHIIWHFTYECLSFTYL